jgi:hypothetical protein
MLGSPLLFSHVPKTAGTSVRALLSQFNPDTAFIYGGEFSLLKPNIDFIQDFRKRPLPTVIMGHFSYGVHRLIGCEPKYACVMRPPVDRVVSYYRMMRRAGVPEYAEFFASDGSIRTFVGEDVTNQTNNLVCRMCSGVPPDAGRVLTQRWLLDLAVHNLRRHYFAIGVMERLPSFTAALSRLLGWPETSLPHENMASDTKIKLDQTTLELIAERNLLDIELYHLALSGALRND